MKIAFFTDSYWPQINGVTISIDNFAEELEKKGHKVLIFAPKTKEQPETKFDVFWIPSISLPTYKEYRISSLFSIEAEKKLKEFNPDIIHCHTPFSVGWIGLNLAKKFNKKSIGTYHTYLPDFLMYLPLPLIKKSELAKKGVWFYTKLFYNKCDLITTPTKQSAEELEKNSIKNIKVLPNGIDFKLFNSVQCDKGLKKKKLVYFGRLSFEKNIEVLIEVLSLLENAELTIIGSGPAEKTLKEKAKEKNLEKKVVFTGALKGKNLAGKVAESNLFITAATMETQGLTIAEAMATGMPAVGADKMAIPETIKEGINGFLFEPFNAGEAAEKINKIFSDKKLYEKLSVNALKTAEKNSRKTRSEELEKLYFKLLKKFNQNLGE
ncbi:glycosyltransferase [Candidatus Micrarchaeota archaeon]|nr:glycosyltransferase [Candidatus Micrarchaeota archaeon]